MPFTEENARELRERAAPRGPGKINKLVKEVFAEVFDKMQKDPETSLETWAKNNPNIFNTLITKLIPVQLDHAGEIINRIIIEDANNCKPLEDKENDSNL